MGGLHAMIALYPWSSGKRGIYLILDCWGIVWKRASWNRINSNEKTLLKKIEKNLKKNDILKNQS